MFCAIKANLHFKVIQIDYALDKNFNGQGYMQDEMDQHSRFSYLSQGRTANSLTSLFCCSYTRSIDSDIKREDL